MNTDRFRNEVKLAPLFGQLTDEQKDFFHRCFPDGVCDGHDFAQAERLITATIRKNEGICEKGGLDE